MESPEELRLTEGEIPAKLPPEVRFNPSFARNDTATGTLQVVATNAWFSYRLTD
jgi:hypothetical protein